jgi:hypothetical protein
MDAIMKNSKTQTYLSLKILLKFSNCNPVVPFTVLLARVHHSRHITAASTL